LIRCGIKSKKIIDSLHIRNHIDKKCKELFSPESMKRDHPDFNTMAAEQIFVWLSRFKRILAAASSILSAQNGENKESVHRTVLSVWKKTCYLPARIEI